MQPKMSNQTQTQKVKNSKQNLIMCGSLQENLSACISDRAWAPHGNLVKKIKQKQQAEHVRTLTMFESDDDDAWRYINENAICFWLLILDPITVPGKE